MSRKQRYVRGLAIIKRLLELKEKHNWPLQDMRAALSITDDNVPIYLHYLGSFVWSLK